MLKFQIWLQYKYLCIWKFVGRLCFLTFSTLHSSCVLHALLMNYFSRNAQTFHFSEDHFCCCHSRNDMITAKFKYIHFGNQSCHSDDRTDFYLTNSSIECERLKAFCRNNVLILSLSTRMLKVFLLLKSIVFLFKSLLFQLYLPRFTLFFTKIYQKHLFNMLTLVNKH